VMLPQMDGFATCQKIRECSQVPIIMVTAMDQDGDKVWGRLLERPIGRLRRRFIL
jgi:DNA-binding response OmpR family regulator